MLLYVLQNIEILFVLDNSFYVKMWLIFFIKKE